MTRFRSLLTSILFLCVVGIDSPSSAVYADAPSRDNEEANSDDEAEARRNRRKNRRNRALRTIKKFDDDNNRSLDILELAGAVRAMIDALAAAHNGTLNVDDSRRVRPLISKPVAGSLIEEFDRTGDEELNGFELDRALGEFEEIIDEIYDEYVDWTPVDEEESIAFSEESPVEFPEDDESESLDAESEEDESESSPDEGAGSSEETDMGNCPTRGGSPTRPIPLPRPF